MNGKVEVAKVVPLCYLIIHPSPFPIKYGFRTIYETFFSLQPNLKRDSIIRHLRPFSSLDLQSCFCSVANRSARLRRYAVHKYCTVILRCTGRSATDSTKKMSAIN